MASDSDYLIQATVTSFRTLEALKRLDGAGVTEVASHLGISKGSAYKHLYTLAELGYVTSDDGTYRLEVALPDVEGAASRDHDLVAVARPEVADLADTTGELVELLVEADGAGEYVIRECGDPDCDQLHPVGERVPLRETAAGLAYLSVLPEDRVADLLDEGAGVDDDLGSRLRRARERGAAFVVNENPEEFNQVAVPIGAGDGSPVGALGVSGPQSRLRGKRLEEHVPGLLGPRAAAIEKRLRA